MLEQRSFTPAELIPAVRLATNIATEGYFKDGGLDPVWAGTYQKLVRLKKSLDTADNTGQYGPHSQGSPLWAQAEEALRSFNNAPAVVAAIHANITKDPSSGLNFGPPWVLPLALAAGITGVVWWVKS